MPPAGTWRRDAAVALFIGCFTAVIVFALVLVVDLDASGAASPLAAGVIAGLVAMFNFVRSLRGRRRGSLLAQARTGPRSGRGEGRSL